MNVLILEDDPLMARLLGTLLKLEGFEAIIPPSDQTVEPKSILGYKTDAILMDVNLGHQNSIQWLPELINVKDKPSFIIMTSGMDLKHECLQAGADAFLLKPYMPDELIKLLKDHKPE